MTMMLKALEYAQRGWAVFPVHGIVDGRCTCGSDDCKSPGKHPVFPGGFKNATTDGETIRDWWSQVPDANVAIATGEASGIFVLDVDIGADKSGERSLAELEERIGRLPAEAVVRTGSGGLHFYFAMPSAPIRSSASRLGLNLDVRGTGGYVVAPPSKHISGNNYTWETLNV
ncbi:MULTISPECIES: bifunctional DNA primase/polymerase [Mameliella]|uniref:bifunctional DNA primase/polymerase n=1 Tax=Mameliella TaxID=1434019 RepID=UPI0012FF6CD2|nr:MULTISPECIES: bifunctional DNA primase/polymerase [Mameliella]MCR9272545.1 bifunctional DNA primase/polymerase [Paracoccaceae bacterium]